MKRLSVILFFCFLVINVFSQNSTADSLLGLMEKASDEGKIDLLNEIALSYRGSSYTKVKEYSLMSFAMARQLNRPDKMIGALTNVAIASVFTGNMDSAGMMFSTIYHTADSIGDAELKNQALLNLGNFYYNTNKYELALDHFQLVFPEYQKNNDTLTMASINQNIGNIYYNQKYYIKALNAFRQSYTSYKSAEYYDEAKQLFNNIGLAYFKLNEYDSALIYFEKGLNFARETNNRLHEMYVMNNTGLLYLESGKYQQAINNFEESVKIAKEIVYPYEEANSLLNIAWVYIRSRQMDLANKYLVEAEAIVVRLDIQGLYRDLNERYYQLYLEKMEYEKALSYFQKFKDIQDSIFGQETNNRIAELNIKYETAKKETENLRLRSALEIKEFREKRLIVLIVIISLLFASLGITFLFIRKYQKQKQTIMEQEALLLKERLEHSQKELASKALRLASQNEFRIKMIETTGQVYEHLDETGKESLNTLLKNLESRVDQSAWQEFETRFEQVHEAFFDKINSLFPDLTPNDRRICAFLKLNMSTKDIALLTHRSPRSIESARYRLKKKFGLDPEEDILAFLQSI
jgi:tetratricopeptide (TPR) repeat protein